MMTAWFSSDFRAWLAACGCIVASTHFAAADLRADNPPSAIFVMKVDGSEVRKIAESPGYDDHSCPRWSHDGKRVAFDVSSGPRGKRELFVVDTDGKGLRKFGKEARPDWWIHAKRGKPHLDTVWETACPSKTQSRAY